MKRIFTPPGDGQLLSCFAPTAVKLFLAGTIEMGTAVDWQAELAANPLFDGLKDVIIFNPRRQAWDAGWQQSINNAQFKEQVDWELDRIINSDLVVFNFEPESKSPITLMELGLVAGMKKPALVYCPEGFWRKGNVEIVTDRFGIRLVGNRTSFLYELKRMLQVAEVKKQPL